MLSFSPDDLNAHKENGKPLPERKGARVVVKGQNDGFS
jgi:hypothetical protein